MLLLFFFELLDIIINPTSEREREKKKIKIKK